MDSELKELCTSLNDIKVLITEQHVELIKLKNLINTLAGDKYLTAKESCEMLGVSFKTFKVYVDEGKIKPYYFTGVGYPKYKLSEIQQN
jgi:hypothetical protein